MSVHCLLVRFGLVGAGPMLVPLVGHKRILKVESIR